MKIIVAGYGFVGKAVVNTIKQRHQCVVVDIKQPTTTISQHPDADGIIICVGTPSTPDGGCNDSNIRDVLAQVPTHIPVLIKSTVLPDLLESIAKDFSGHSICHSPEFLRAKSADFDFANQSFMIIGGQDPAGLWQDLFRPVLPKCNLYFNCTLTEAATIKYTSNTFLALKLSFFNQIYDLCQSNGADYNVVRQILTHDSRIGNSHTLVPGADGNRGFGGHCFPKDTKAFRKYAYGLNTPITTLDSAMDYNETVRKDIDIQ